MKKPHIMGLTASGLALCVGAVLWSGAAGAQSAVAARPFTQAERTQGAQAHTQILAEFGEAYTGPQANYVRDVGQGIAVQTGLSTARSDFTVTLLNSPVNNAFALPGGYVYVTRQLMALMNNEAELAGVLGHEYGHTYARHAQARQRRATRNSIVGVLATVLGGAIGDNGGLLGGLGGLLQNNAMRAAQVATLGFSRSQETAADDLGIRYLQGAGYDPMALSTMLASLAAQNDLEARVTGRDARAIPEWASTHPDPASRVRRAATAASRLTNRGARTNRDQFLNAIDNVLYSDDPAQGIVEGREFLHPVLRLAFTAPQGFGMMNAPTAVSINGTTGQAQFQGGRGYDGNLDRYIEAQFRALASAGGQNGQQQAGAQQQPQLTMGAIRRTDVNGIPAAYATARANTQQGQVDVTVFAYEFARDQAYHFVAITPAGRASAFDAMFTSVRRLTPREASAIRPRRVDVVTVGRNDTVDSLSRRMAYAENQLARFQVLNGLTANSRLAAGQRVKIIVYGTN